MSVLVESLGWWDSLLLLLLLCPMLCATTAGPAAAIRGAPASAGDGNVQQNQQ
jgi:hypothetical protein